MVERVVTERHMDPNGQAFCFGQFAIHREGPGQVGVRRESARIVDGHDAECHELLPDGDQASRQVVACDRGYMADHEPGGRLMQDALRVA